MLSYVVLHREIQRNLRPSKGIMTEDLCIFSRASPAKLSGKGADVSGKDRQKIQTHCHASVLANDENSYDKRCLACLLA
jgi:hypothetical protein